MTRFSSPCHLGTGLRGRAGRRDRQGGQEHRRGRGHVARLRLHRRQRRKRPRLAARPRQERKPVAPRQVHGRLLPARPVDHDDRGRGRGPGARHADRVQGQRAHAPGEQHGAAGLQDQGDYRVQLQVSYTE